MHRTRTRSDLLLMQRAAAAGSAAYRQRSFYDRYVRRVFQDLAPLNAAYEQKLGLSNVITAAGAWHAPGCISATACLRALPEPTPLGHGRQQACSCSSTGVVLNISPQTAPDGLMHHASGVSWALAMWTSRASDFEEAGSGVLPFADLGNYASMGLNDPIPDMGEQQHLFSSGCFALPSHACLPMAGLSRIRYTAGRSYRKGEAFTVSYGLRSSGELLRTYGFAPASGTWFDANLCFALPERLRHPLVQAAIQTMPTADMSLWRILCKQSSMQLSSLPR